MNSTIERLRLQRKVRLLKHENNMLKSRMRSSQNANIALNRQVAELAKEVVELKHDIELLEKDVEKFEEDLLGYPFVTED